MTFLDGMAHKMRVAPPGPREGHVPGRKNRERRKQHKRSKAMDKWKGKKGNVPEGP